MIELRRAAGTTPVLWFPLASLLWGVLAVGIARGAGSEPASLHTARQQAKGGTGIASTGDATALFHNPAGLSEVGGFELLAAGGLALADLHVTPRGTGGVRSTGGLVPFGMVAAALRVQDWITLGLAWQPVAGGRPEYEFEPVPGTVVVQKLDLAIVEVSPGVSLNVPEDRWLPGKLSFGLGYRLTSYSLKQSARAGGNDLVRLDVSGWNTRGIRVGVQYRPRSALALGLVYRSALRLDAQADSGLLGGEPVAVLETRTVLPAKWGIGARLGDGWVFGSFDLEYALGSQNEVFEIEAESGGRRRMQATPQQWKDASIFRFGLEFLLGSQHSWPLRVGYIRDGEMTSQRVPSLFSSPPTETHSLTFGGGYNASGWSLNAAVVERFGSVVVPQSAVASADECGNCGGAGFFGQQVTTFLLDWSLSYDL